VSVFRPPYKDPKTGERRQSRVWWYEFWVGGRRIRESARTTRKTVAIEAENRRRAAVELHASRHARWFGPIKPDWYVFPASNRRRPVDPARPVGSLKRAWEAVRRAAGVNCRLHDLRHTFCTKLAEAGIPEQVMFDIMGQVSQAMLKRYSHIRLEARRRAIEALERAGAEVSVGVPKEIPKCARPPRRRSL
jgi:integrase